MKTLRKPFTYAAAGIFFGSAATLAVQSPVIAQSEAPQNMGPAAAQAMPPQNAPGSFADLAARLQPAVVNVSTTQQVEVRRMPFGGFGQGSPLEDLFRRFRPEQGEDGQQPETREASSLGSGFVVSPDGYIVTNNHVVTAQNGTDPVDSITVTLNDEREYEAKVIGRDPLTDLALLKVDAEGLPYVRFGNSESVRVGDWVVAIGNPFGLGGTVTAGIVSALHRAGIAGAYDRFIQTDASINRGNSGGPMFDLSGNVIGINTAIFSPTGGNVGIGFAIPASQAQPVIEQLRTIGRVRRGYLGVSIQDVDEDLAAGFGLDEDVGEIVASVEPGGPAETAGIRRGDIIVRVNGQEVTERNNLSTIVAASGIGSTVPIELIRDGKRLRVNAQLAERPSQQEIAAANRNEPEMPGSADDRRIRESVARHHADRADVRDPAAAAHCGRSSGRRCGRRRSEQRRGAKEHLARLHHPIDQRPTHPHTGGGGGGRRAGPRSRTGRRRAVRKAPHGRAARFCRCGNAQRQRRITAVSRHEVDCDES